VFRTIQKHGQIQPGGGHEDIASTENITPDEQEAMSSSDKTALHKKSIGRLPVWSEV